jgi:sRNA-binding protein
MASKFTIDRKRGAAEAWQQIAVLRERWPAAFPADRSAIRPLQFGVAKLVAAAMGWSDHYAFGVLTPWKASMPYCRAVLRADLRITLEGEPAEPIDDEARKQATDRLAQIKAKVAKKQEDHIAVPAPSPAGAPALAISRETSGTAAKPQPAPPPVDSSGRLSLAGMKAAALARRQAAPPC